MGSFPSSGNREMDGTLNGEVETVRKWKKARVPPLPSLVTSLYNGVVLTDGIQAKEEATPGRW